MLRVQTGLLVALASLAAGSETHNLLFLLTDQHNPRMLGAGGDGFGGTTLALTPSLDRLAAQGVHVPHATCTSPQCVPSRVSLLTGRWPHEHGVRSNNIWEPAATNLMLPELLRRAGYTTGSVGKHHLFWLDQEVLRPTDHGYDSVVDMDDYAAWCAANGEKSWSHPDRVVNIPHLPPDLGPAGYTKNVNAFTPSGFFAERSIAFLEARAPAVGGDGAPFALWTSFVGPHTPILPSGPDDPHDWAHRHDPFGVLTLPPNHTKIPDTPRMHATVAKYASMTDDQHRELLARYYGLVSQIDFNIGRILRRLDELGLAADTLVVMTSDHGEYATEMGAWKKGGSGAQCLLRVPLLLRLPGYFPAGSTYDGLLTGVDLAPTIAGLLGLSPTERERRGWSGLDHADALRTGTPPKGASEVGFMEFRVGAGDDLFAAFRTVDKFTWDRKGGEFYGYFDLVSDPWELNNLVVGGVKPPGALALEQAFLDWFGDPATHRPEYLLTGHEDEPPARASEPHPSDNRPNVRRDVDLRWMPATSAAQQVLELGLGGAAPTPVATLGPMARRYNPGTIAPSTQVRWRVLSLNEHGVTPSPEWTFFTATTPDGPQLASAPSPADGAVDVARTAQLTWSSGADAQTLELWFARAGEPLSQVLTGPASLTSWDPPLEAGAAYRWRVDTTHAGGTTRGTSWQFATSPAGLPAGATDPLPAHLALDVALSNGEMLGWNAGANASAHRVHFGTEHPLPLRAEVTSPEWAPGPLEPGRTYFWRIDEVNARGTKRGRTWRFTSDR